MKYCKVVVSLFFLFLLTIPSFTFAEDAKSLTENYIDGLHNQGKERVIVSFKDDAEVDASLVDKYGGKLIRRFNTIKALVCEIPMENMELLKAELSVKSVAPDIIMKTQPVTEMRDPEEISDFLQLKGEYFRKISEGRMTQLEEARKEYIASFKNYLSERKRLLTLSSEAVNSLRKAETAAERDICCAQVAQCEVMLEGCNLAYKEALEAYRNKAEMAKNCYAAASSNWEVVINEEMTLLYSGPATVRWNNLEKGINSKAAWNNYNLDGAGVKIAILDTGINYNLSDLGGGMGPGFKCLGGYDFVDNDDDPIYAIGDPNNPNDDEIHGTEVAALAVGKGATKAVGPAYNASYYALRTNQGPNNPPPAGLVSDVMAAIEWASTEPHKADIISMSIGAYDEDNQGDPFWPYLKQEWEAVCNNAYNAGVILVAGSGNKGYSYSAYPAAFANVISVGAHAEDQTIASFSNGGVDIVAPGKLVYSIHPDNTGWLMSGTSFSTPHASALIALQLQYAREYKIQPNNGHLWEVMKHSAVDLGLGSVYQGKGKIWAARTDDTSPDRGSINLLTARWPLIYDIACDGYAYLDENGYPAFYIGTSLYQDITLLNNTHVYGSYSDDIENLEVTTTQAYYGEHNEDPLPGASTEVFPTITLLTAGDDTMLEDGYYIPWDTYPGLDRTILDLEFEFMGDPLNRLIKVAYPYATIWCPPPAINEGFPVE